MHHYHTWLLFDWILFLCRIAEYSHRGLMCVGSSFARTFTSGPARESTAKEIKMYVNIIHNFILLPLVVLSFIRSWFIMLWYNIYTQLLYSFSSHSFKVGKKAECAPITGPLQSNCGGTGGIFCQGRHSYRFGALLCHKGTILLCRHVIASDLHVINRKRDLMY